MAKTKLQIEAKRAVVLHAMRSVGTRTFSVTFIKKDGTLRTINAQMRVTKHLRGTGPATTAHLPQYTRVFDHQKEEYRNVNLDTVQELVIDKNQIHFYQEGE